MADFKGLHWCAWPGCTRPTANGEGVEVAVAHRLRLRYCAVHAPEVARLEEEERLLRLAADLEWCRQLWPVNN